VHREPRNEAALHFGRPSALHLHLARHRLEVEQSLDFRIGLRLGFRRFGGRMRPLRITHPRA
jgi:hypothetical protein